MISFPAFHSIKYTSSLSAAVLHTAVVTAFEELGISADRDLGRIEGRFPFSIWSFGEVVTVRINPNSVLEITSRCVMPSQWFDWGKNRQNVEKLIEIIENSEVSSKEIDVEKICAEVESSGVSPVEKILEEKS